MSETLYYKLEHPSGLTVLFIQKKTAILRMQYLEQKYGSIDNQFRRSDEDTVHTVPEELRTFGA